MQVGDARRMPGSERRAAKPGSVGSTHHAYCSTGREPVAIEVYKRGRWCVVAKITTLDGEPILAIAHRGQHGVNHTISVPLVAVDYAERAGCDWLYFRRDTTGQMWRCPVGDLRRIGWLATSDGVPEVFVKIDTMQRVPWQGWGFAERSIRLGDRAEPAALQLALL